MKKLVSLLFLLPVCCFLFAAPVGKDFPAGSYTVRVTFFAPEIVRVTKFPAGDSPQLCSETVLLEPSASLKFKEGAHSLSSSALTVKVDEGGRVQFFHKGGLLLEEKDFSLEPIAEGIDKGAFRPMQRFTLKEGEAVYGLGTIQDGKLSRRGTTVRMEQRNIEDFHGVLQSVGGWGVFWDNYSPTQFTDNAEGLSFDSEAGDAIDYYFLYGGGIDRVNGLMRKLTGSVPMMPLWSYGYMQSKERYGSQEELVGIVREYRRREIPLDVVIQDWQYWGSNYTWNAQDFLTWNYSRPRQMVEDIHGMNARVMISVWACFGPMTPQYHRLDSLGLLLPFGTFPTNGTEMARPQYPSGVKLMDVYSPVAQDIYYEGMQRLQDYGLDGWWMDSTDPDYYPEPSDYEYPTSKGSWRRVRNLFPLDIVRSVYTRQRGERSDKRITILTRSAFAGQQHYGSNMWSGDVVSSWEMLRSQVPAGLNYSVSGSPHFNTDIGGFFCGNYNTPGGGLAGDNPQFQELYVRWMQYAFFCPMFRSHGTAAPREIWRFGEAGSPVYEAIASAIRLRYRFLPYLYSTAWSATDGDGSFLRPLAASFPGDRQTWDIAESFLFGADILALPVLEAQYTPEAIEKEPVTPDFTASYSIRRYLPAGTLWWDFDSEKAYAGGQDVQLETGLSSIPMMVRAGAILPLAPAMQYTGEKPWDDLEIKVYPGADGSFVLYEDAGDSYDYENGAYTRIRFSWDEAGRTLTVGAVEGSFPGMLTSRTFRVRLAGTQREVTIPYTGKKVRVRL